MMNNFFVGYNISKMHRNALLNMKYLKKVISKKIS